MAFCKACGQEVGAATFCPKCGASQSAAVGVPAAAPVASPTEGMQENVAGLLCYIFGWLSGLIFLLIDKRPFVRFHAAQSIGFNIVIIAVYIAVGVVFAMLSAMHLGMLAFAAYPLLALIIFGLWVFLMYKAYQHEKYMLPVIGNVADGIANK